MTTLELRPAAEAATANKDVVELLRELLKAARAGELRSLAVVYVQDEAPCWAIDIEPGKDLMLASVMRSVEETIRGDLIDME